MGIDRFLDPYDAEYDDRLTEIFTQALQAAVDASGAIPVSDKTVCIIMLKVVLESLRGSGFTEEDVREAVETCIEMYNDGSAGAN